MKIAVHKKPIAMLELLLIQISPSVFIVMKPKMKDLILTQPVPKIVFVTSTSIGMVMRFAKDVMTHYVVNAVIQELPVMYVSAMLTLAPLEIVHVTLDFTNPQHKLPSVSNVILPVKIAIQQLHVQHVKKVTVQEKPQTKVVSVKLGSMTLENLYVLFVAKNA